MRRQNSHSPTLNKTIISTVLILVVMMMLMVKAQNPIVEPIIEPIVEPTIDSKPKNIAPAIPIEYKFADWNFYIQFSTLDSSILSGSLKMMETHDIPITATIPTFNKKLSKVFFFTMDFNGAIPVYPPNASEEDKAKLRATKTGMEVVFSTTTPTPFGYDPYSYRVLRYDATSNTFSEPVDALKIDLDYSFSIDEAFGKKIVFGLFVFNSPIDVQFGKKLGLYYPGYLMFSDEQGKSLEYLFPKANYFTPSNPVMVTVNPVKQKYEKLGDSRVLLSRFSMTITKNPLQFEDAVLASFVYKNADVKDLFGNSNKIYLESLTCIFLSGNQELMPKKVSYENGLLECHVNPLLSGDHEFLIVANNANPPEPMTHNPGNVLIGLVISAIAITALVVGGIGIFLFIRRNKMRGGLLFNSEAAPTISSSTAYDSTDI